MIGFKRSIKFKFLRILKSVLPVRKIFLFNWTYKAFFNFIENTHPLDILKNQYATETLTTAKRKYFKNFVTANNLQLERYQIYNE